MLELRNRYANLYMPSDFFYTFIRWSEIFTIDEPFSLNRPSSFHIFHRSVKPIVPNDAILEPPDADPSFGVRVNNTHSPLMTCADVFISSLLINLYRSCSCPYRRWPSYTKNASTLPKRKTVMSRN